MVCGERGERGEQLGAKPLLMVAPNMATTAAPALAHLDWLWIRNVSMQKNLDR
jgi:hypothetical protein